MSSLRPFLGVDVNMTCVLKMCSTRPQQRVDEGQHLTWQATKEEREVAHFKNIFVFYLRI